MSDTQLSSDFYYRATYRSSNPFEGARLKLKRAKRHLFEITEAAQELTGRRKYNFLLRPGLDAGKVEIVFMEESIMPLEFSCAVGDAIHNLRSAFDHIAVVLSTPPIGTGKAADAYFPTGTNREEFIKARDGYTDANGKRTHKAKMKGAHPDALRMVEELEPYGGGKHSLRPLHDLDVLDKHKLIVPTVSRMTVQSIEAIVGKKRFALGVTDFKPTGDGRNLVATIDLPFVVFGQVKIQTEIQPAFEVVFGKGQPLEGEPIIPTLSNIADTCEGLIKACQTHFRR